MSIADRIQALRKAKGISQEELADHIGVSRQAVSKWESEQSLPDIERIIALSDYFETTTDYILKGIEELPGKAAQAANALIFAVGGTTVNAVGLVTAVTIWAERKEIGAAEAGLVLMLFGSFLFLVGQIIDARQKEQAKRVFLMANVWILPVIPLYCVLFILRGLLWHTSLVNVVCWLVYFAACVLIDIYILKRSRKTEKSTQ